MNAQTLAVEAINNGDATITSAAKQYNISEARIRGLLNYYDSPEYVSYQESLDYDSAGA